MAPRSTRPNNPCGRRTSTAIRTRKNVKRRPGRGDLGREHGLAHAHEERRDDRAAEAAEPAEHDDREEPRDQVVVAARVEREDDPVDGAGGGRRRHAQPEADRRDALRVDAEQLGRRPGSGRRPHRSPEAATRARIGRAGSRITSEVTNPNTAPRDDGSRRRSTSCRVARDRRAVGRLVDDAEQALDAERDRPRDEQRELLTLVAAERPQEGELQRRRRARNRPAS